MDPADNKKSGIWLVTADPVRSALDMQIAILEEALTRAANAANDTERRTILRPWSRKKRAGRPKTHTIESAAKFLSDFEHFKAQCGLTEDAETFRKFYEILRICTKTVYTPEKEAARTKTLQAILRGARKHAEESQK